MLLPLLTVTLAVIGLLWSADRFVGAAAATAWRAGMSKLLVGMTVVSLGTSAPEIVVAVMASLDNAPDLAIGNALGSNIANIALVLGVQRSHLMTQRSSDEEPGAGEAHGP